VVSTRQLPAAYARNPQFFRDGILLAYAPVANGHLEELLIDALRRGQNILLYGPSDHAGAELRRLLELRQAEPIAGEVTLKLALEADELQHGTEPRLMQHRSLISGGPINTVLGRGGSGQVRACATVSQGNAQRVVAVSRPKALGGDSGTLAWVRGSFCCSIAGERLPTPDDPARYFQGESLMRLMLAEFGYLGRKTVPDS
jgi:hypothetical protein